MSNIKLEPKIIKKELEERVKGEVAIDDITRNFYSTDASVYRIVPSCVVRPKGKEDVKAIIEYAYDRDIPIHPRGGGSGLGGACLGPGIVLTIRDHMNKIIEINEEESYAIVQTGAIMGNLNHELAKIGKIVYVDNSSEKYSTIGGNIGTNSSGSHAVKYGYMADFVEELTVILSNGEEIRTRPIEIGSEEYKKITADDTLEARIYKSVVEMVNNPDMQNLISEKWPKVKMNVSGYNLKDLIQDNKVDLSYMFLGSEGTLGVVLEAKLKFIDKPIDKTLIVMDFDNLADSGRAVDLIVNKIGAAAIEILGKSVIKIGIKMNPALKKFIPEGIDNILYVEFDEQDEKIRTEKVEKTRHLIIEQEKLAKDMRYSDDPVEQAELWYARHNAVPLLQRVREPRRIMAFVEDQTVPLEYLGNYMVHLREDVFPKYGVKAAIYGHASKGLIHTRPFINTKDSKDLEVVEKIAEDVNSYVIKVGGSISGEHNEGMMRINFVEELYGEALYENFKQIKALFDPKNILNPDKKITDKKHRIVKNLRYGGDYSSIDMEQNLYWELEWGWKDVVEQCHGCGKCTVDLFPQRDCPVYRVKRDDRGELASPRARANLMRGIISGQLDFNILYSKEAREIIEDCAGCMMCTVDCPSGVNIPKAMFDVKTIHYKKSKWPYIGKIPRSNYFTGNYGLIANLGSKFSPISNIGLWGPNKYVMQLFAGVHHDANFPKFRRNTFQKWFKKYRKTTPSPSNPTKKVALFHGCFANYTENTDIAIAEVQVLEKNNIEVVVPNKQVCCGIPLLANGLGHVARKNGEINAKLFAEYVKQGYDVITQCSSCYATLKDQLYETLIHNDEAKLVKDNTYFFSEYILKLLEEGKLNNDFNGKAIKNLSFGYHEPCHLISTENKGISIKLFKKLKNIDFKPLNTECCGQIGSWGFKSKNYKYSQMIAERSLYPEAKRDDIDVLVTDCPTCKLQLLNVHKEIYHPTQVLREAYGLKKL